MAVLERDKYLCQRCLSRGVRKEASEAHHIIHKGGGRFAVRWDMENGISLCRECHNMDAIGKEKGKLQEFCFSFIGDSTKVRDLILKANNIWLQDIDDEIARLQDYLAP